MHLASSCLIQTFLYDHLISHMTQRLFWLEDTALVSHMWIVLQNSGVTLEKKKKKRLIQRKCKQWLEKRLFISIYVPFSHSMFFWLVGLFCFFYLKWHHSWGARVHPTQLVGCNKYRDCAVQTVNTQETYLPSIRSKAASTAMSC